MKKSIKFLSSSSKHIYLQYGVCEGTEDQGVW